MSVNLNFENVKNVFANLNTILSRATFANCIILSDCPVRINAFIESILLPKYVEEMTINDIFISNHN
ncbi:hypothetical protein DERP_006200 [Dermatophagoides pteronyssinus]|uniref:Uncharacterized protein n=1 Tax=Dermatophagoides pteronyssinus TaxID=6956 RepID=A0ABQ8IXR5_DERPT|nr:hypothetical protein DERP_006200 [Dermatophagoides pteronyssinus]